MQTVVGLSGMEVRLAAEDGRGSAVQLPALLGCDGFEIFSADAETRPPLSAGALNGLPAEVVADAMMWEGHVLEVLTGVPPDAGPGARARPEYDPTATTLLQREQAKATEMAAAGYQVTARTVRRKRLRYQATGIAGLADGRADRSRSVAGRGDDRVVHALQLAVAGEAGKSTKSAAYYMWRTRQILDDQHGAGVVPMPAWASFYRLFDRLTVGQHTTGSARTRQSRANQPEKPFGQLVAARPGEYMEIDSTPFDVMVLLDDGVPGRVELTGMIDLATRSVTAAILRPTPSPSTRRCCWPVPARPSRCGRAGRTHCGWPGRCSPIIGCWNWTVGWNMRRHGR